MNACLNFTLGALFMFVIIICILINVDNNYNSAESEIKYMRKLCLKLDSIPLTYDISTVTCKNAVIINYLPPHKESK